MIMNSDLSTAFFKDKPYIVLTLLEWIVHRDIISLGKLKSGRALPTADEGRSDQ